MPLYQSITEQGYLSAEKRARIAEEVTRIHHEILGAPPEFVRVVFLEIAPGSGFTAGRPAPQAVLVGYLRGGRKMELKTRLLTTLWDMYARETGADKDDQLVFLDDYVSASHVMEKGAILPEPGEEAAWLAIHGKPGQDAMWIEKHA